MTLSGEYSRIINADMFVELCRGTELFKTTLMNCTFTDILRIVDAQCLTMWYLRDQIDTIKIRKFHVPDIADVVFYPKNSAYRIELYFLSNTYKLGSIEIEAYQTIDISTSANVIKLFIRSK